MSPNITTSLGDARRSDVRRIKRNLFGPIDQEKTKAWLENELENLLANACDKWDFDFKNEKPLNCERSEYVWERIEPLSPKSVAMRGLRFDAMDLVEDEQNNNVDNSVQYVKTGDILGFKQRQTRITGKFKQFVTYLFPSKLLGYKVFYLGPLKRKKKIQYFPSF
ncbi:hypothetical protein WDU94_011212 [Cyamophila willieti]